MQAIGRSWRVVDIQVGTAAGGTVILSMFPGTQGVCNGGRWDGVHQVKSQQCDQHRLNMVLLRFSAVCGVLVVHEAVVQRLEGLKPLEKRRRLPRRLGVGRR